jgi:hypothetical protein
MKAEHNQNEQVASGQITSIGVLCSRMMWTVFGPLLFAFLVYTIAANSSGWFTGIDACYAAVLIAMIACRWHEQRSGSATTISGQPATQAHFRRYAVILALLGMTVWLISNILGNHLLG